MVSVEQFGRIGVLMGGISSEREISLKSGKAINDALKLTGCHTVTIDIVDNDIFVIREQLKQAQIDLAFIALHGKLGEDGTIQSLLEDLGIPYTGSGTEASRMAFDKTLTQTILKMNYIPVAPFVVLSKYFPRTIEQVQKKTKVKKVIVKPAREGSSIGVTIAEGAGQLQKALETAWQFDDIALVEKFIEGRELTVGILKDEALPVIEIKFKNPLFDFTSKYQSNSTEYIIPAKIPESLAKKIQQTALKVFFLLGCSDFARLDFMLEKDNKFYVLEINTIPGFTGTSLLPKAAKAKGISFEQLCLVLVECAYAKKNAKDSKISACSR